MSKKIKVLLLCDDDEYELPRRVADTPQEMAKEIPTSLPKVMMCLTFGETIAFKGQTCKIVEVEIDEDDDDGLLGCDCRRV